MSTLRDLLESAFYKINVLGQGEGMNANQLKRGLTCLDQLTDSLSNEKLMIYSIKPYIFNTNPGQKIYTMGPTSDAPGAIQLLGIPFVNPGTSYSDGSYQNVPLTGGSGTGAKANITINLGSIIDCQIAVAGVNYLTTDQLSFDASAIGLGTGSGFLVSPALVTIQTNWVIPRPMKIDRAYTIWNDPLSAQAVDIPIALLTMEQYAAVAIKNTSSTFAFSLYDDNAWPTRSITLFPIPQNVTGIRFWLRQPLVDATEAMLDVEVDYPPGYERMYVFNLAIELSFEFGKTLPPGIAQIAAETIDGLKRQNASPVYRKGDGALSMHNGDYFNYITGNPGLSPSGWWGW